MRPENEREIRRQAEACEALWEDLCAARGEYRYVEMLDRHRRCYGRLCLPSEVLYVWNQASWVPSNDSDAYGNWEPIVSQRAAP